jgi:hypothetical protein
MKLGVKRAEPNGWSTPNNDVSYFPVACSASRQRERIGCVREVKDRKTRQRNTKVACNED